MMRKELLGTSQAIWGGGYNVQTLTYPLRQWDSLRTFDNWDKENIDRNNHRPLYIPAYNGDYLKQFLSGRGWTSTATTKRYTPRPLTDFIYRPIPLTIESISLQINYVASGNAYRGLYSRQSYITGPSFRNPGFGTHRKEKIFFINTSTKWALLRIWDNRASFEEALEIRLSDGQGRVQFASWGHMPMGVAYADGSGSGGVRDGGTNNGNGSNLDPPHPVHVMVFNQQGVYHGTRGVEAIMNAVKGQFPIRIRDPYDGRTYTYNY